MTTIIMKHRCNNNLKGYSMGLTRIINEMLITSLEDPDTRLFTSDVKTIDQVSFDPMSLLLHVYLFAEHEDNFPG